MVRAATTVLPAGVPSRRMPVVLAFPEIAMLIASRWLRSATSVLLLALCSGCSSQRVYGAGQAWQRNECMKINDAQERARCLAAAGTSYESYQRQAEEAKGK
jgi:hypothetical protein